MISRSQHATLLAIWRIITQVVIVCAIITFLAGIIAFYDAPIAPRGGGFMGKWGIPHSEAHYHAFKLWETSILVLWPVMFSLIGLRAAFQPEWALKLRQKHRSW